MSDIVLKICLIVPKGLPVPNVKGGAIETLVTDLINQNEIEKKIDITVCSIYNKEAYNLSKKYKMTNFCYIKNNLKYKFEAILVRIKNLFGKNLNTYNECVLSKIKHKDFDYIVIEDGAYFSFSSYLKYFSKDKMILHFHHVGKSDINTDNTYSNFIGVSDFVVNAFKKSSSIKNCYTVKNGIDLSKFKKNIAVKEKTEIRKRLGFREDDFIVMYCGRLVKEKGVLELVKAIKEIQNNKIKLMIVGSINFGNIATSEYLNCLNNEIEKCDNKIITTGYIDYKELYKYYKISDVLVVPSIVEEAAGLVNIEAMASELPVIVTNSGGLPEFISDETVVISRKNLANNIKESILMLYNNSKKIEKMKNAGKETAELYSTEEFYKKFINCLEER